MRIDRSKNINSFSMTRVLIAEIVVLAFSTAGHAQTPRQILPALDDDSGDATSKSEASDEMSLNFSSIDANRDGALNLDELERALDLVRTQHGGSSPGNKSTEATTANPAGTGVFERVEHHETDNDGVALHYVTLGKGPVILFVHGFPDFWFTWRQQMAALSDEYKTVAMDMRAYNKSGKPEGVEHYTLPHLLADVEAVIKDLRVDSVTLVGHDWGGVISWQFAMRYPHRVNKLVICNLTHPRGYATVRRDATAEQKANTQYINDFQTPGFEERFTPETLARISLGDVSGVVWESYVDAFARSSIKGMLDYYRAAYPGLNSEAGWGADLPNLTMPVLQFHGLKDKAVDKDGLRDTWNWIDENYTLVTIPSSGHWVQRDAADIVSDTMRWWLKSRPSNPVPAEAPYAP